MIAYCAYQYSNAKRLVDASTVLVTSLESGYTARKAKLNRKETGLSTLLGATRLLSMTAVANVPGGGTLVKYTFDTLDSIAIDHGPEIEKWVP